jgi:hypothetical protein
MTEPRGSERWILIALLVVAVAVRVATWWFRPAFWGDESALAMNISPRSFSEIGRPYVFWQICPWLFLVTAKALTLVFGDGERALRLLPLLGGIAVPPLAYVAAKEIAGGRAGLFAVALTAISPRLVYYSGELKPYSTDATVAAAAIALTAAILRRPEARWLPAGLVVLGAFGVWLSLPAIFVLAGCGAAVLLAELFGRRRPRVLALFAIGAALWCGGFFVHLTELIAKGSIAESSGVATAWSDGFMPFPPATLAELRWLPGKLFWSFHDPGGFHRATRHVAGVVFAFGAWILWRKSRPMFAACLAPLAILIVASALGRYPLLGRLIVFLVPVSMVVLAIALDALAARSMTAVLVAFLALHVFPASDALELVRPPPKPDLADFAKRISVEPRPADGLYIDDTTKFAYLYYDWRYPPAIPPIDTSSIGLTNVKLGEDHVYLDQLFPLFGRDRVYVLVSTFNIPVEIVPFDVFITDYLDRRGGRRLEEARSPSHLFVIYDLSDATP